MRTSLSFITALAIVAGAASPSQGQRLLSRHGATVLELRSVGPALGSLAGSLTLPPGCATSDPFASQQTWAIGGGTFLAWERFGGVCIIDARSGRVRSLDTSPYADIAAVRATGFGLVVAHHTLGGIGVQARERLYLLNAFDAEWTVVDLAAVLPPPTPFSGSVWSYDISAEAGTLIVIESRTFGSSRSRPLMTRIAMADGAVLGVVSIDVDVLVAEVEVSRDGSRAVVTSDDWCLDMNGVLAVDTASGAVLVANASILPHKFGDLGRDSLIWDERANRVVVVTQAASDDINANSLHVLDATTLAVVGVVDAPGIRVPVIPGNEARDVWYSLMADPGTHTAFLVEHEFHYYRYTGGGAVARTLLYAIDVVTGTVRQTTNLLAQYGPIAGALTETAFVIPSPPAPEPPQARVIGALVDLQWTPQPDVLHYLVEAGMAAGRADLVIPVPGPSLTVPVVPPGTYYVRVRAVGVGGAGPRSGEIVVIVP